MKAGPLFVLAALVSACAPEPVGPDATRPAGGQSAARDEAPRDNETTRLFRLMGANTTWTHVETIPMRWQTFHTQGLVKIDDVFYVSAVEVLERTAPDGTPTDALRDFSIDRSTGAGRGWLFTFDRGGDLLGRVELTDEAKYHPGGLDYDGRHIWVAVAEYRPNSRSNIVRVDPATLGAEIAFATDDHIGAIVHNVHGGTLHGASWGARRLYTWTLDGRTVPSADGSTWMPNPQAYIDYQDCHYQGVELMLCGGVRRYTTPLGVIAFGGLDLIDLRRGRPEHQVPVSGFVDEGAGPDARLALTHNAFWVEPRAGGAMRAYFMTETDNQADLLVYDATP